MHQKITSLTNRTWKIHSEKAELSRHDDLLLTLAKNRNISDLEKFIKTTLSDVMPDPFVFVDMERAVSRIVRAIRSNEKIAILGDYDVDGVSSTAMLMNFFNYLGVDCTYSIPNRISGYGLSIENIDKHRDCLIIAVDCGSSSLPELAYAMEEEIDIVVIDHHKMELIPEAVAIVNPHRPDEKDDYKTLCATGLVFMCCVGISRALSKEGFYAEKGLSEPIIMDYLDLVALATICDVVNLVGLNRSFVSEGLKIIRRRKNLGIDALTSLCKNREINSDTVAFFFGPRLNAAGRISSADLSVRLLTTKNPIEAKQIALQLEAINKERQEIEAQMFAEAIDAMDHSRNFICCHSEKWHLGVIGIVAGRLREKFNKPSIVISFDSDGNGKASCRSTDGLDLSDLISKGVQRGIISSGGGHAMAAGFSIKYEKMDELIDFLQLEIQQDATPQELYADCFVDLESLSMQLMRSIFVLQPFGMGNRYPKFVIPNLTISSTKSVGENHIALVLQDDKNNSLRAISFKSVGTPVGEIILSRRERVNALGALSIGEWKGEKYLSFQLEDIAEA